MSAEKSSDLDFANVTVKKVSEFSVSSPDNKKNVDVQGILCINDKIIIADNDVKQLKLFDDKGNFLSSTGIEHFPRGISHIENDKFATCGYTNHKVLVWTIRGQTIASEDEAYDVDDVADGIHYNGTYYCVLLRDKHTVTILDRQGRRVRKIVMKKAFGKMIEYGWDIHMDRDNHNIYVPCVLINSGVLCMSVEGEALWFTPMSGVCLMGITEIHDALCIADSRQQCVHLISKTGQYMKKLLEEKNLDGHPQYIYYDEKDHQLYINFSGYSDKHDTIYVYKIQ